MGMFRLILNVFMQLGKIGIRNVSSIVEKNREIMLKLFEYVKKSDN